MHEVLLKTPLNNGYIPKIIHFNFVALSILLMILLTGCGQNQVQTEQVSETGQASETESAKPQNTAVTPNELRVVIDGKVNNVTGCFYTDDYYFDQATVQSLLGAVELPDAVQINSTDMYSLREMSQKASFASYEYDNILDDIYIWKSVPAIETDNSVNSLELERAKEYGFMAGTDDTVTFAEYMSVLDQMIGICDTTKVEEWQGKLTDFRKSNDKMTRIQGFYMMLCATETLGGEYFEYNADWLSLNEKIGDKWGECNLDDELFPDIYDNIFIEGDQDRPRDAVLYFYAMGRKSLVSGKTLFDYDEKSNSMRTAEPLTTQEAVLSAVRLIDSISEYCSLDDSLATEYDGSIITNELLDQARVQTEVTLDTLPYWGGFVYGHGYRNDIFKVFNETDIRNMANWGFDSTRLCIDYRDIFNDDVSSVNISAIKQLDRIISFGMKYNVHIEIEFCFMPGWWTQLSSDYVYSGSLDLYTNPEHQKQAQNMWSLLAKRYKDIPNSALSFYPIYEAENWARSTGTDIVSEKNYTQDDITETLMSLIDAIKAESPDRLITFEVNGNTEVRDVDATEQAALEKGILLSTNFAAFQYVYWTWNESGTDDRTRSYFMPDWPLTNYLTQTRITGENYWKAEERNLPMLFDGILPKGTEITLYVSEVQGNGTFVATADGSDIYTLDMNPKIGEDGCISDQYGNYAFEKEELYSVFVPCTKTKKAITFTLEQNTKELSLSFKGSNSGSVQWSQIDVTLPDENALDRWYMVSRYDADLSGTEMGAELKKTALITIVPREGDNSEGTVQQLPITINEDLTYTTDIIESAVDRQFIEDWVINRLQLYENTPLLVRFESARFNGAIGDSTAKYYGDILSVFQEHNISWYCNDFEIITVGDGGSYAGDETVTYKDYDAFDKKIIEVLQEYQSN